MQQSSPPSATPAEIAKVQSLIDATRKCPTNKYRVDDGVPVLVKDQHGWGNEGTKRVLGVMHAMGGHNIVEYRWSTCEAGEHSGFGADCPIEKWGDEYEHNDGWGCGDHGDIPDNIRHHVEYYSQLPPPQSVLDAKELEDLKFAHHQTAQELKAAVVVAAEAWYADNHASKDIQLSKSVEALQDHQRTTP